MSHFKLSSNSAFGPYDSGPRLKGNISISFSRPIGPGSKDISRSPGGGVTAKACDGSSGAGATGVAEGSVDEPAAPSLSGKSHV